MSVLTHASMMDQYQEERLENEDPLFPFPSFAEWKQTYLIARQQEMDETVIEDFVPRDFPEPTITIEKVSVVPVRMTRVKAKAGSGSNMDKAKEIYKSLIGPNGLPQRKEVMALFMQNLGLTKACASTYAHNIKQIHS